MKALISPNEIYTHTWISSWVWVSKPTENNPNAGYWGEVRSTIDGCERVAQVVMDVDTFEIAPPLHWVECPDTCIADSWYFKNGEVQIRPVDVPMPVAPVETLP